MREDEKLILRMDTLGEFPEGIPVWAEFLPIDMLRKAMYLRREGFTKLGFDPAHDEMDRRDLN